MYSRRHTWRSCWFRFCWHTWIYFNIILFFLTRGIFLWPSFVGVWEIYLCTENIIVYWKYICVLKIYLCTENIYLCCRYGPGHTVYYMAYTVHVDSRNEVTLIRLLKVSPLIGFIHVNMAELSGETGVQVSRINNLWIMIFVHFHMKAFQINAYFILIIHVSLFKPVT